MPLDARPPRDATVLVREAVRALVVDGQDRLLLFHGLDPADPSRGAWWFTPGGGIEPRGKRGGGSCSGLREETGLQLGHGMASPQVWWRTAEFRFDGCWYRQTERYFMVRVDRHAVSTDGFEPHEKSAMLGHRWWRLADLVSTSEVVYPISMAMRLPELLKHGAPPQPERVD